MFTCLREYITRNNNRMNSKISIFFSSICLLLCSCAQETSETLPITSKYAANDVEPLKLPSRSGNLLSWEMAREMILTGKVKSLSITHMYGLLLTTHRAKTYQSLYESHNAVSTVVKEAEENGIIIKCGKE